MTIKSFADRKTCKLTAEGAVKALAAFAAELGITVDYRGGQMSDLTFTAKIAFTVADADASADAAKKGFEKWCELMGLKPEHYGQKIMIKGEAFEIVGIDPAKPKNSIKLTRCRDQKGGFIFPADATLRLLARAAAAAPLAA